MFCFYLVSKREYYCTVGVAPKSEWLVPARADSTYLPVACILYGDFEDRGICVVLLTVQDIMTESSCHYLWGGGGGTLWKITGKQQAGHVDVA